MRTMINNLHIKKDKNKPHTKTLLLSDDDDGHHNDEFFVDVDNDDAQHMITVLTGYDEVIMDFTVPFTAIRSRRYRVLCSVLSQLLLTCLCQ